MTGYFAATENAWNNFPAPPSVNSNVNLLNWQLVQNIGPVGGICG